MAAKSMSDDQGDSQPFPLCLASHDQIEEAKHENMIRDYEGTVADMPVRTPPIRNHHPIS